jgi:DNA-binding IscR family transcriptional regulator
MAKLSKAGLVETSKGKAGVCRLAKDASKISLLDIYRAVDAPRAFAIHSYKEYRGCPISVHIKASLERALGRVQKSMEGGLAEMSLADVIADVRRR